MFTGIIQGIGSIVNLSNDKYQIITDLDLSDCKIGSSLCCNGVCLTVTKIEKKELLFLLQKKIIKWKK